MTGLRGQQRNKMVSEVNGECSQEAKSSADYSCNSLEMDKFANVPESHTQTGISPSSVVDAASVCRSSTLPVTANQTACLSTTGLNSTRPISSTLSWSSVSNGMEVCRVQHVIYTEGRMPMIDSTGIRALSSGETLFSDCFNPMGVGADAIHQTALPTAPGPYNSHVEFYDLDSTMLVLGGGTRERQVLMLTSTVQSAGSSFSRR